MRILVATQRTNGDVDGDYGYCVEGEIVYMQDPCGRDTRNPDKPGCGCGRAFSGTNSHVATSTALVVESALNERDVREAIRSSMEEGGWLDPTVVPAPLAEEIVSEAMLDMTSVANHFPVGSVVRRRLSQYFIGDWPLADH